MVDDDMKLEALPQTNHIKTIVTAELPLDLERKGKQNYQGWMFSQFTVFVNGTMKSLYDRSERFFGRILHDLKADRFPCLQFYRLDCIFEELLYNGAI